MPKINSTALLNFRHRVVLCHSYTEGIEGTVDITQVREKVQTVFASINPVKGSFYLNGFAMQENRNAYSHNVYIRYNRNMDITGYAWLYEDRPSGKRWYKVVNVLEVEERQRFWNLQSRLVQKDEDAIEPRDKQNETFALPKGARL